MSQLKTHIMRKIYFIWFIRRVFSMTTLKAVFVVAFALRLSTLVSVSSVFSNLVNSGKDFSSTYQFILSAVSNTETATILSILAIGIFAVWLVHDFTMQKEGSVVAV